MKRTFYIILFLLACVQSHAQMIKYPISNYTQKEYGRGQEAQNWSVVQDNRGLMYFGNSNGILEFDGRSWRFIPVKSGTYVTSLDCDTNGVIYAGAQNDFGMLIHDNSGKLVYKSLADTTDIQNFAFSTVWKTIIIDNKVFFQSDEMLFVYQNGKLEKIKAETSFHLAFKVNNELWVKQRNKGLYRYQSGNLRPINKGDFYKDIGICGISEWNKNTFELLITTFDQGFYIYNCQSGASRIFDLPDAKFFTSCNLYGALKLSDGYTAINSTNRGLFILNQEGRIVSLVNEESGLQVNDIKQVYQDRHNNLWLAMNNGLAKVNYTSPLSFYGQESGISGNVNSVCTHQNQLFIGTSTGLYRQMQGKLFYRFERVPGLTNQVWSLADMGAYLIIAASDGLFIYKNNMISNAAKLNCRSMYPDIDRKLLYIGGNHGLAVFSLDSKPVLKSYIDEVTFSVVQIAKNKNSVQFIELWLGTSYQGALRVAFDDKMNPIVDNYNVEDGLPAGSVLPFENKRDVIFATNSGLFSFVNEEAVEKMLPDSVKKKNPEIKGYFEPVEVNGRIDSRAVTLMLHEAGNSFVVYNNILNIVKNGIANSQPFSAIDFGKLTALFINNNTLWIGADEGIISYQLDSRKKYEETWDVMIRTISVNDSAWYFGSDFMKKELAFGFGKNRLTFDFAGLFYDHPEKIIFSYKLEGFEENWSGWSNNSSVTFTGLREGKYTLRVKAKNVYGIESREKSITFRILPPWYRSVWAYLGYFVLFGLFVWLLVVLSRLGLKRKNEYLEAIVAKEPRK